MVILAKTLKNNAFYHMLKGTPQLRKHPMKNSYLCNQLGNALFCVTYGIFAGRAQLDPAKSHELHKIAFPNVLHTGWGIVYAHARNGDL
jgi:hypothetical protein